MWFYVAKSVFMWLKVVLCGSKYVLPKKIIHEHFMIS